MPPVGERQGCCGQTSVICGIFSLVAFVAFSLGRFADRSLEVMRLGGCLDHERLGLEVRALAFGELVEEVSLRITPLPVRVDEALVSEIFGLLPGLHVIPPINLQNVFQLFFQGRFVNRETGLNTT